MHCFSSQSVFMPTLRPSPPRRPRAWLTTVFLACAAAHFSPFAAAAPADDVKRLLENGNAAEAFKLGMESPGSFGDPAFDFYFGVAATDSGNAAQGVLALERYLLAFPENLSARTELARAYFALGEDQRAREEFEDVRKRNPPANVAATLDRFLDAIRLRETRYRTTTGVWIEAGMGHDSNANAGVSDPNITLPVFGPVLVAPAGVKTRTGFGTLAAGAYISHPIAPGVALFATGQADGKWHTKSIARAADQGNLALSAGASWLLETNLLRASVNYSQIAVDNTRYRTASGLAFEWTRQLSETQSLNAGLSWNRNRFNGINEFRNHDVSGLGIGYRHALIMRMQPVITLGLNYGDERSKMQRDDLVRRTWGVRAGLALTPAAKWGVSMGLTYQNAQHRADFVSGLIEARRDKYWSGDASVTYLISKRWSARAEANLAKNRSNLSLFEYGRNQVALKLRYELN